LCQGAGAEIDEIHVRSCIRWPASTSWSPLLLSGVRPQAVVDALVLMQTGRALAARRVLEALEEDLSQVADLTRRWAVFIANEPAGEPS
jgi:hypothetical protein